MGTEGEGSRLQFLRHLHLHCQTMFSADHTHSNHGQIRFDQKLSENISFSNRQYVSKHPRTCYQATDECAYQTPEHKLQKF